MNDSILGIESSCDDTAVAVVDKDGTIRASVIAAQTEIHSPYGGVVPEFAGRAHIASILPAVEKALSEAHIIPRQLRAIGVTRGPGLIGSLLVGLNTAAGLGMAWGVPVIGINHLRGHLRSVDLGGGVKYPAIILFVSGGHTFLAYIEKPRQIMLLGSTRDDSVGEAYDKVGRMLHLGYPGGPAVDKEALRGKPSIAFPRPMLHDGFEFSFSGLKSAVSRYLAETDGPIIVEDVAASFVEAMLDVLLTKCRRALGDWPSASLGIVGGVAASPQLRSRARTLCDDLGIDLCLPPLQWSTDNAVMIALAAWDYVDLEKCPRPLPQLHLSISDY